LHLAETAEKYEEHQLWYVTAWPQSDKLTN
jgi:hypothetical protein